MKSPNTWFFLRMLFSSLFRRRARLITAVTGVALGAAVLLGLVTLCYDIPRQMARELRSYGANMVFVAAGGDGRLTGAQVEAARRALPPASLVGLTPFRYESARSGMAPYTAAGTDFESVRKTSPYWRVTGAWPENGHEALIGEDVARAAGLAPGSVFPIDGRTKDMDRWERKMTVSGVVATGGVEDGFIFMPLSAMEELAGDPGAADLAEASLMGGAELLEEIREAVKRAAPGVEARIVTRVSRSEERVLSKLTALVFLVTLVVLSLTMICVATTMMTVVLERRREIGLKKALGAGSRRISREFLAEGALLGVCGGLVGSVLGLLFARLVSESVFGRALSPEWRLIPITVLASALVSVAASLIPVSRAVDVEPAVVLRGE